MIRSKWKRFGLWCLFGVLWSCVFAAATLISRSLIELEQAEREARHAAAVEENLRLALWRLDSILSPLLAVQSLQAVPEDETEWKSLQQGIKTNSSPLDTLPLTKPFCISADMFSAKLHTNEYHQAQITLNRLREYSRFRSLALPELAISGSADSQFVNGPTSQSNRSRAASELSQRAQNFERASVNALSNNSINGGMGGQGMGNMALGGLQPQPFTAFWDNDKLRLARHPMMGTSAIEGWELDWPKLQTEMKQQISDLLPNAEFKPVTNVATQSSPDMLVSIPCLLVPGSIAGDFQDTVSEKILPVQYVLLALWLGVLTAAGATGFLLGGALRLSDRRAAFVAAVTHELRTPLTTLQLYSEMLGSGMIQSEETKQSYLVTLQNEVQRIVHLVENVFAYARLEKGRKPRNLERISLNALMNRSIVRLQQLAERANMELVVEPHEAWDIEVNADASMVEQILVNLVDNAGKYAKDATDRRIFLKSEEQSDSVAISVEDRGSGFARLKSKQNPFSKSVQQAAESAPGIGLGLAISQRFAKELGGRLVLSNTDLGARACLLLPKLS